MKIKKRVLNEALRVLGKVVCQTSPVELYRSIRFVGDERGIRAMATDGVEAVEAVCENWMDDYSVRSVAESFSVNVPGFKEFKNPRHPEFSEPTRYSLLNAFTETIKKYTPLRVDQSYMTLNRCFGLDDKRPAIW